MLNGVKSKIILKKIFGNVPRTTKLEVIKYNHNLQNTLNINLRDIQTHNLIQKVIQTHFVYIEDIDIEKLEFYQNEFVNDILEDLHKAEFKRLKKLNLNDNYLSDINVLRKMKLNELLILDLGHNRIEDIQVLEHVKFEKLEILCLNNNYISDINVLEKTNFKNLKELYLNNNNISDIEILKNVDLK